MDCNDLKVMHQRFLGDPGLTCVVKQTDRLHEQEGLREGEAGAAVGDGAADAARPADGGPEQHAAGEEQLRRALGDSRAGQAPGGDGQAARAQHAQGKGGVCGEAQGPRHGDRRQPPLHCMMDRTGMAAAVVRLILVAHF